jgi:hypothetical protein
MAGTGRCAGCGKTGSSNAISRHIIDCPDWQAVYARDPDKALDPVAAYEQWMTEGKQEARVERREALTAQEEVLHTAAEARWATPKDMLED